MMKLILVLGSPNDNNGILSLTALDRNNCALNIYLSNDNIKLLCTGGFGEHFNKTKLPHAQYAKDYLISKGVDENDFLPLVLSSNTYEDMEMVKPIIEKTAPDLLIVITSDFHMERVKILYEQLLNYPKVLFIEAASTLSNEELKPLILHEKCVVRKLKTTNRKS